MICMICRIGAIGVWGTGCCPYAARAPLGPGQHGNDQFNFCSKGQRNDMARSRLPFVGLRQLT